MPMSKLFVYACNTSQTKLCFKTLLCHDIPFSFFYTNALRSTDLAGSSRKAGHSAAYGDAENAASQLQAAEFWELVTKLVFWGFLPNSSECHSFGIPLAGGLAELSRSLPIKLLRGPKKAQNRA